MINYLSYKKLDLDFLILFFWWDDDGHLLMSWKNEIKP